MNIGITGIEQNVGVSFETTVLFIVLVGSLVFYARDFKLGLIISMVFSGLLFMWFYTAEYNYVPSVIMFFIFFILLSLSLYPVSVGGQEGVS